MSDTVVPRTFPYRPSGGFTSPEIWGGPSGPGHDDVPDGATTETKERLKMVAFSALDSLLTAFQYRISPERPSEVARAPGDPTAAPDIPMIRIEGVAPQVSRAGMLMVAILGGLLLVGIFKEGGIRA